MACRIKRSDRVKVIAGSYKGTVGIVGNVVSKKNSKGDVVRKVSIRGVEGIKKKVRSKTGSGYEDKEIDRLFDVSNVALYDVKTKKHYKTSFFFDEDGVKGRRFKKIDVVIGS